MPYLRPSRGDQIVAQGLVMAAPRCNNVRHSVGKGVPKALLGFYVYSLQHSGGIVVTQTSVHGST